MMTNRTRIARLVLASAGALALMSPSLAWAQPSHDDVNRFPPEREVTSHNAAILYFRAWINMEPRLGDVYDASTDGTTLPEDAVERLEQNQETVRALLKASRQDHADWDVEYEQGLFSLMPHLGKMRASTKVLAGDAVRCAQSGDTDGAAERIAAIYRSAMHVSTDRILISPLVGIAMSNLANTLTDRLAEKGSLTPGAARTILSAMHAINPNDPINLRASIVNERDILPAYFLENFTGPDAGARIVKIEGVGIDSQPEVAETLGRMSHDELANDIRGYTRYYDDVLSLWNQPDAAEKIAERFDAASAGEYGVFARVFSGALNKVYDSRERFRADYAKTEATLTKIANP